MDGSVEIILLSIGALGGLAGLAAFFRIRSQNKVDEATATKTSAEAKKVKAEADDIHAQIADRWAEHVDDLQTEVRGLRLDIAQVRRENEEYRKNLTERDAVIADLKDWAARLVCQVELYAPAGVKPESFRRDKS